VPDTLDLEPYRAKKKNDDGVADGEKKMAGGGDEGGGEAAIEADMAMVEQLKMMGEQKNTQIITYQYCSMEMLLDNTPNGVVGS
jgi:hypothetical protein